MQIEISLITDFFLIALTIDALAPHLSYMLTAGYKKHQLLYDTLFPSQTRTFLFCEMIAILLSFVWFLLEPTNAYGIFGGFIFASFLILIAAATSGYTHY